MSRLYSGSSTSGLSTLLRLPRPYAWRWVLVACLLLSFCHGATAQQGGTPSSGGSIGSVNPASGSTTVQTPASSTGNSAEAVPVANPILLYPGEDFRIGVGDLLSVSVYLAPDFVRTVRVGLDGTVQLPYIGAVHVLGLSVRQAQTTIAQQLLAAGIYANPDVLIQVLDTVNGTVSITGEMKATVPVTSERTLRDVLLTAGGLPPQASHTINIVRPGVVEPITVKLGADLATSAAGNIPVYPHDIIQISRAGVVYVIGAFKNQGAVPLDQAMPLTLMQLAALSGGVGFEGKYEDLRLIRTEGAERKVVQVDIKKVLNGKAPDPVLEANDIVFLPTNNMKAILKSLGIGGVLGLVSLALSLKNY